MVLFVGKDYTSEKTRLSLSSAELPHKWNRHVENEVHDGIDGPRLDGGFNPYIDHKHP